MTGKRKGSHGNGLSSTELNAPAVLYWFKLVRQPGQSPRYESHLIDSEAGVGTQVTAADVNGDGLARHPDGRSRRRLLVPAAVVVPSSSPWLKRETGGYERTGRLPRVTDRGQDVR